MAVGRLLEGPRRTGPTDDARFWAERTEEATDATRVPIQTLRTTFVPKDTVASLSEFHQHPIVTAPMGTVFPLTDQQWRVLQTHLTQPPPPVSTHQDADLPGTFAWEQRRKSVTPLPGGTEAYQETLAAILEHVANTQPDEEDAIEWLSERFDVGERRARYTLGFLQRVSVVRPTAGRLTLTPEGERWLEERAAAFLVALIHSRVQFVGEMLAFLREPRSPEQVLAHANDVYAMGWTTRAQVDRRRHLLGGLGMVAVTDEGQLGLTEAGERVLARLELHSPRAIAKDEERPKQVEITDETTTADPMVEELVNRLHETCHLANVPGQFEQAVADAFRFLGFDSQWLGGAGRTDVLLAAELGPEDRYRTIIDAKTTAQDAIADGQVDWETLDEHKEHYGADYVMLVGPAFRSGRLEERASSKGRHVVLLDVPALADLVRQHADAPLGLDDYRSLFDPARGVEHLAEVAETTRRELVLAGRILGLVHELEADEGPLDANDLYWNLKEADDEFEPPTREEIDAILTTLSGPPFRLLRKIDGCYGSIGSYATIVRRLRLLVELIQRDSPRKPGAHGC